MAGTRRLLVAAALSAGLIVLVLATVAGPGTFVSGGHRPHFADSTPSPSSTASATNGPMHKLIVAPKSHTLAWLGTLIAWGVIVLIVAAVLLAVWVAWQHRPRRAPRGPDVHFDVVPLVELERTLAAEEADQMAELEQGDVRNAIVRCWLRLEDNVAAAGLPRRRSETSTEFTVRVLKAMDIDPRAIGRLAGLFREARFSDHTLPETARAEARAAWQRLHEDLTAAAAARSEPVMGTSQSG